MQRLWWLSRKYLNLIRRERSGLLTLTILFTVAFGLRAIVPQTKPVPDDVDLLTFYVEQDEAKSDKTAIQQESTKENFFAFDPNTLDAEGFVQLGLSEKQAKTVLNYREKAGGFRTKHDLSRIYVLPEGWYERHETDILLPDRQDAKKHTSQQSQPAFRQKTTHPTNDVQEVVEEPVVEEVQILDINRLDSLELIAIRGVGPKSAHHILKYRDRLGGFHDTAQYSEVWGLHPAVRQRLIEVTAPLSLPEPFDLNTADLDQLKSHPYISYKLARSLVAMRKHRGGVLTVDDLKSHHLIDDELLERLMPYLHADKP